MKGHVVVIHGLWMNRVAMMPLARRLRRAGWVTHHFGYASVRGSLDEHAARLQQFINNLEMPVGMESVAAHIPEPTKQDPDVPTTSPNRERHPPIHLVAHSLGGLVCRQFIAATPDHSISHIVNLGTPHQGSVVAGRLATTTIGRKLLGESLPALTGDVPMLSHSSTAVIAGNKPFGMGRLIFAPSEPSDGTVLLSETMISGLKDHITMPVTHFGMLFSKSVASQVDHYLDNGHFRARAN